MHVYILKFSIFKRIICAVLALLITLSLAVSTASAEIADAADALAQKGISAQSAVLIEASTGRIIYSNNAGRQLPMASTTKIMTALVALEKLPLDTVVRISADAVGIEGSSIYLYEGEQLTLEDLLYALMLESANDAAVAIAIEVAGGVDEFASLMNQKAAELGLDNTHFSNPHGLDADDHYTTAYEQQKFVEMLLEDESIRYCPHGRPVLIEITKSELEKQFGRIQ
jgi:D-alanyl-D-alanine carboxypeptidase (penicillin-binding protein 5/6)